MWSFSSYTYGRLGGYGTPTHQGLLMNILCWNFRGTASRGFVGVLKEIKKDYYRSMMILVEIHTSRASTRKIAKKCGFKNTFILDANE